MSTRTACYLLQSFFFFFYIFSLCHCNFFFFLCCPNDCKRERENKAVLFSPFPSALCPRSGSQGVWSRYPSCLGGEGGVTAPDELAVRRRATVETQEPMCTLAHTYARFRDSEWPNVQRLACGRNLSGLLLFRYMKLLSLFITSKWSKWLHFATRLCF